MRANSMKFFRLIAIFAVMSGMSLTLRAELADGVQAIVNDTAITYSQTREFTAPEVESLRRQYAAQPEVLDQKLTQLFNDALEQLVERQLILHDFDVEGYKLPDSVVDGLIQDRIRERYGNRTTFMQTLQAQGETFEQFRKDIRDQYIVSALRDKNISQEIIISPYEVENYYLTNQTAFKIADEVKLRMIVLKKTSTDDTNTVKLAGDILTKYKEKDGPTFEALAIEFSQKSQQQQGGDLVTYKTADLRKELAEAATTLKPGQVSDVIDTPDSCYLILVEDKRPAHVQPLGEVRDDIEKTLRAQEQSLLEKQWIDGLKKKTFIRYF
jgi:parvulin-like peptidyl-prolyl isomerase